MLLCICCASGGSTIFLHNLSSSMLALLKKTFEDMEIYCMYRAGLNKQKSTVYHDKLNLPTAKKRVPDIFKELLFTFKVIGDSFQKLA